jgi:hypothetical protein
MSGGMLAPRACLCQQANCTAGPVGGSRSDSAADAQWRDLGFSVERVTGIEPALSAWESDRSGPLTTLTWAVDAPLVTVIDPVTPG